MIQGIIRTVSASAIRGDSKSQRLILETVAAIEAERKREAIENVEAALKYKAHWGAVLERRRLEGTTGPDPVPHPDHIYVDVQTNQVICFGPVTEDDKELYRIRDMILDCYEQIDDCERRLAENPEDDEKAGILEELNLAKRAVELFASKGFEL